MSIADTLLRYGKFAELAAHANRLEAKNELLRYALKRALPILEENAADESVFWGGPEHQVAKDAVETYEQARAALAEGGAK